MLVHGLMFVAGAHTNLELRESHARLLLVVAFYRPHASTKSPRYQASGADPGGRTLQLLLTNNREKCRLRNEEMDC